MKTPGNPAIFLLIFLSLMVGSCEEVKNDVSIIESVKSTTAVIDTNIKVQVKDGVVTMDGEVVDEVTKTAAMNAVKHIEGVKSVESRLTLKPITEKAPYMTDRDVRLKQSIDSALVLQNIRGVNIAVSNGEVTLSGKITQAQEAAAIKIVEESQPARLNNELRVTDKKQ